MVLERIAKSGARVAGSGIGGGIGGFLSSPFGLGLLGITAIGVTLFIFKDRIGEFFAGLKFPEFPEIKFPEFPTITFPEFPTIVFPPFPTLPPPPDLSGFNLCSLFGIGCDEVPPPPPELVEDTGLLTSDERDQCACGTSIVQDIQGNVNEMCLPCGPPPPPPLDEIPPPPPDLTPPPPPIIIDPELDVEGDFEGGGPSFIGGSIGQTPITTLFQVLGLFPGLSASGAANFLFQFSGISPSDALNLEQFMQFQ